MTDKYVLCFVSEGGPARYAYFTAQPLREQTGDDWDDAPYEHNCGDPYDDGDYRLKKILFDGPFLTPADVAKGNSSYSVEMINRGDVAWLKPDSWGGVADAEPIPAGVTIAEFKRLIRKGGGTVYKIDDE